MDRSNRRVVIGLAGSLGCALLAIAFLLGRISAKPTVVTVAAPPAGAVAAPAESVPPPGDSVAASPEKSSEPRPITEPSAFVPPDPEIASTPATSSAPFVAPAAPSADRQQIAAYFKQADRLEDVGAGDPQAFATSLLQSVSSGDFSSFDELLAKARAQRQRLQAIAPPRACVEHHRLALTLSADSVTMLERLKAALMKGDTTALLTISTEGKALEAQTERLKSMAESIKRQAGL